MAIYLIYLAYLSKEHSPDNLILIAFRHDKRKIQTHPLA